MTMPHIPFFFQDGGGVGWVGGAGGVRNLRNGGIFFLFSAAARTPPRSSSNKRISFNLVTAGASRRTAADLSPPSHSEVPDELSDLWKFTRVCLAECGAVDVTFTTASTAFFSFPRDMEVGGGGGYESRLIAAALVAEGLATCVCGPQRVSMGTGSQEIVSRYTRTPRVGGARGEREIKNSRGVAPPVVSPAAAAVCRHRRRMRWRGRFHQEEEL